MKKLAISMKSFEKNAWNFMQRMLNSKAGNAIEINIEKFENVIAGLVKTYKSNPFKRHSRIMWDSAFKVDIYNAEYKVGYLFSDDDSKLYFKLMKKNSRRFKRVCQLVIKLK